MASDPAFTNVAVIGQARISTANTNRDGTGTLGTVVTGSTNGTKVTTIRVKATGTTTAGVVRVFISDNASNIRLLEEALVTAITPSTTVETWEATLTYTDLVLPSGYSIKVSTHNAETFDVHGFGGNY